MAASSSTAGAYGFYDDGSFRVLYVGKDAAGSVLRHSYGDSSRSDNVFASMFDIDMPAPEDAVPYLDDSNEEQMAAHIARRQSLLRRSLRRVRFVRPQHAVRTAPVL
ncbi:hypothetical protein IWQ56_002439 [Coemansia nantahalensis]|nr:hypothetical protein IWQ56_002439 [Coemansia nantahalensis]